MIVSEKLRFGFIVVELIDMRSDFSGYGVHVIITSRRHGEMRPPPNGIYYLLQNRLQVS